MVPAQGAAADLRAFPTSSRTSSDVSASTASAPEPQAVQRDWVEREEAAPGKLRVAGTAPMASVMEREFKFDRDPKPSCKAYTTIPCCFCCACVSENEQWALLYFGKYEGTLDQPGCHCLNHLGLQVRKISTKQRSMQLSQAKVLDAKGNPVVVNAAITFVGTSARKATVDVENPWPDSMQGAGEHQQSSFLELQASAVLKHVCSRYPYEAPAGEHSLQTEGEQLAKELKLRLQERVEVTGAKILSYDLLDLSYAPEIAQLMQARQQASAFIDARRLIVQAAVDMASSAVEQLKQRGVNVSGPTANQITSNLLTVICSNQSAQPVVTTG